MSDLKAVLAVLDRREQELAAALAQIRSAKATLRAVFAVPEAAEDKPINEQSLQRMASAVIHGVAPSKPSDKPISWVDEVYAVLRNKRRPMHITDIIKELEQRGIPIRDARKVRDTISGVIARKARQHDTFVLVGKGVWGLLNWSDEPSGESSDASITSALLRIVREHPGQTSAEIVDRLEQQLGEEPEDAQAKRNSRVTRLGQLYRAGMIQRIETKFYALAAAWNPAPELELTPTSATEGLP